ncbi:MAG TPA: diadenylate cyclase [Elusimicrobiota bacterium]|jgi:uncharacterized protein (TIGR00159 family)|nr:diadenylate cyclase [Elusimicrobiota bacterium]
MPDLFLKAVGVADLLDIALVAVLIYALLVWFKQAKAAFVAKGILVIAAVYLFARAAGMVMTTWLFHGFFAILLIALVVIFQEELRSIFERIAVWSLSGGAVPFSSMKDSDIVVGTLEDLARDHIGALIVIRGNDPLDRHLEGGWSLNGEVSEALLKSIFDRNSIGHDGALIVEGGRVTRFGCRLPLSKDSVKTAKLGTRHAAALGLAELTDALCLVVSEERGTISIARAGRLDVAEGGRGLGQQVEMFCEEHAPVAPEASMRNFFRRNVREKAAALLCAGVLWMLFVLSVKDWRQTYTLPIHVRNVPAGLKVVRTRPERLLVAFSGHLKDFYWADVRRLYLRLDLPQAVPGVNAVEVSDADIVRPPGFVLEDYTPAEVEVEVARPGAGSAGARR